MGLFIFFLFLFFAAAQHPQPPADFFPGEARGGHPRPAQPAEKASPLPPSPLHPHDFLSPPPKICEGAIQKQIVWGGGGRLSLPRKRHRIFIFFLRRLYFPLPMGLELQITRGYD
jgi:hypothetical protein